MITPAIHFLLSALVVIVAGVFLVRFSERIAELTKLGRLFVGSVFLAGATSLPELFVDLNAVKNNMPDLAVGDLMGSSLFNLLILAIGDLIHKGSSRVFSRASAAHALAAALSIGMTALAGIAIFIAPRVSEYAVGGMGIGSLALVLFYLMGLRLVYFDQKGLIAQPSPIEAPTKNGISLRHAVVGYLSAALIILFAAPYLAQSAGKIAELSGLGKTFIGTSLLAFSTSLPELVSTVSAVRMGAFDLAIGNIFGSNAFNMILIAPLDFVSTGPLLASVSQNHIFTCLATVLITSVAAMGQLYQVEKRKKFIEPDAFVIILLVILSLLIAYSLGES